MSRNKGKPVAKGKPAAKQASGWEKMKRAGRRAIMLSVTPAQYSVLRQAAFAELRPLSQFVLHRALQEAEEIIRALDEQEDIRAAQAEQ